MVGASTPRRATKGVPLWIGKYDERDPNWVRAAQHHVVDRKSKIAI